MQPYTLSIQTDEGTYTHGFHLGTNLKVAMQCAEEILAKRKPVRGSKILGVTLKREGEIDRYFDGDNWF